MELTHKILEPGVELLCVRTDKFKTGVFSVSLVMPLKEETATAHALIADVLYRGSGKYPDIEHISAATDELYGASVGPSVRQRGEGQSVCFSASFIDDCYALDGTGVLEPTLDLLGDLLLNPVTENGVFRADFVRMEGVNLADQIRARINEKRGWSIFRLTQEMCAGEAYALDKLGSAEEAETISPEKLWDSYQRLLKRARVVFYYGGSARPQRVEEAVRTAFGPLLTPREARADCLVLDRPAGEVRSVTDRLDVGQGKLAMGFRTGGVTMGHPDYPAMLVFNALYGGTTNSRLFLHVRERLSLCYFAASMLDKIKGLMVVSSGVEFEKFGVARDEILAQLDVVRRGEFTREELDAAKQAILSGLRSGGDSQGRLEDYWVTQMLGGSGLTAPEELMAPVEGVTARDVARVAQNMHLDTIYYLEGKEDN